MQEKDTNNRVTNIIEWVITISFTIALFISAFLFAMDLANAESMSEGVEAFYNNNVGNCENIDWFLNSISYVTRKNLSYLYTLSNMIIVSIKFINENIRFSPPFYFIRILVKIFSNIC